MSWLLDKASALLDAADGSAADIAKDQGFGEEENARDKVKKRKEARRAAQVKKEKADAQAVAAAAEKLPEIDEAAEAQQADGLDAEAVSSEEPSDGVEQSISQFRQFRLLYSTVFGNFAFRAEPLYICRLQSSQQCSRPSMELGFSTSARSWLGPWSVRSWLRWVPM